LPPAVVQVSIPRSGFCSFKLVYLLVSHCNLPVSIPRSGFCSFKLDWEPPTILAKDGFNPSVGILFIQALLVDEGIVPSEWFQSLGRDSVHSSIERFGVDNLPNGVSIPRSGFCSFKLSANGRKVRMTTVSIPRSGFCSFKHLGCSDAYRKRHSFNPSVGILFIQASSRFLAEVAW